MKLAQTNRINENKAKLEDEVTVKEKWSSITDQDPRPLLGHSAFSISHLTHGRGKYQKKDTY